MPDDLGALREDLRHVDAQCGREIVLMLLFLRDDRSKLLRKCVVTKGFSLSHALAMK